MSGADRRIAIAYDCLFPFQTGGGERVYGRMAELLAERGAQVTYVTRAVWPTGNAPPADFRVVGVWRGEIHDAAGTRTTSSAVAFAAGLFRHFARNRRAYDDVIVAALPVLNVFAVRLALLGTRTRIAVDWLEVWPWAKWRSYAGSLTGTIAWVLQSLALRLGDVHTVNSRFTRERIRRLRPAADPVVLGLVDLVGERSDASLDRPAPPVALFVGRHIPDKRLDALPAALAAARRDVPGLELRIVGDGPETDRVRVAAGVAGVADAVGFLGRVDDASLRRLYREAHVLVNPSAREGFGLVVVEAAAAATPSVVVTGPDNAAADLVDPGINGEIADDASAEALGAAMVRALRAGRRMRESTLAWFERERVERGLARSVDELLTRLSR